MHVPDLFRVEDPDRAALLYALAIVQCRNPRLTIALCRRVRTLARRAGDQQELLHTCFAWEVEALLRIGEPRRARDLLRRHLRAMRPLGVDLAADVRWSGAYMAPVLFANARYAEARAIYERFLREEMADAEVTAYDVLFSIYNDDPAPRHTARLTLVHIYRALGLSLSDWPQWPEFVGRLHPELLALAGTDREGLLLDPSRVGDLLAGILSRRAERVNTGLTRGQADVIEPAEVVAASHAEIEAERAAYTKRTAEESAKTTADVYRYFPFLQARKPPPPP